MEGKASFLAKLCLVLIHSYSLLKTRLVDICLLVINVFLRAEDAEIQKKYFSRGLLPRESGRINLFVVGSTNQRGYVHLIRQWGQIYSVFDNKR